MINVTKITEENKNFKRTYFKLEQVKTYKSSIVDKIIKQSKPLIKQNLLLGELGHNNEDTNSCEIDLTQVTHKIISIKKISDTDINIVSYCTDGILFGYLTDQTSLGIYNIPLSYTLRGVGNPVLNDFKLITFDLADEKTVGKNPLFVPENLINDIAKEQASL